MAFSDYKFGVVLPTYAGNTLLQPGAETYWGIYDFPLLDTVSWQLVADTARKAESLGYESLWVPDHLMLGKDGEVLEVWTVLSALSTITSKVKLGSWVLCNNYRNPGLVAKMAATLATISHNRLILGYGAGWYRLEYEAYGYRFPSASERVEMLREGLCIIKGLLEEPKYTFHGKYYSVMNAVNNPKPSMRVPLIVGGWGRRILEVAAEYADGWDIGADPTPEQYRQKVEYINRELKKRGRRLDEFMRSIHFHVLIARDEDEFSEKKKAVLKVINALEHKIVEKPSAQYRFEIDKVLMGTPKRIRERLRTFAELGCQRFILMFMDYPNDRVMELFAASVL